MLLFVVSVSLLAGCAPDATAEEAACPQPRPAPGAMPDAAQLRAAVVDMLGSEVVAALGEAPRDIRTGTCVAAVDATHPGQRACTLAIRLGAAVNETQADFHWDGCRWIAQPSTSQDLLPFPDPALDRPSGP